MERHFCDGHDCNKELTSKPRVEVFHISRSLVGKHRTVYYNLDVILTEDSGDPVQLCKKCRNKLLGYAFEDLTNNLKYSNDNTK